MENDNCEKVILIDLEGSGHNSYPNNYQRLIGERKTLYFTRGFIVHLNIVLNILLLENQ
jgi:hypothetical protein